MSQYVKYATKEDIKRIEKEIKELKNLIISFIEEEAPYSKDIRDYEHALEDIKKRKFFTLEEIEKERAKNV